MKKPVKVKIFDHEYLIKSDEDDNQVLEIARFVNDIFEEIKDNTEGLSEAKTAILAAFHIASDYFQILKEHDELENEIQKRAKSLNYQIDSLVK